MATPDEATLDMLASAGFPLHLLSDEQRQVCAGLTADEAALLISLKERFAAAEPEVLAHTGVYAGGVMF
jgi:hypothetical protein